MNARHGLFTLAAAGLLAAGCDKETVMPDTAPPPTAKQTMTDTPPLGKPGLPARTTDTIRYEKLYIFSQDDTVKLFAAATHNKAGKEVTYNYDVNRKRGTSFFNYSDVAATSLANFDLTRNYFLGSSDARYNLTGWNGRFQMTDSQKNHVTVFEAKPSVKTGDDGTFISVGETSSGHTENHFRLTAMNLLAGLQRQEIDPGMVISEGFVAPKAAPALK